MVPSVPQLFLELARGRSVVELGLLMMEACGLFAVFHETPQSRAVLNALRDAEGELERGGRAVYAASSGPYCNACYDESGKRLLFIDAGGESHSWRQATTSTGRRSDMWARLL